MFQILEDMAETFIYGLTSLGVAAHGVQMNLTLTKNRQTDVTFCNADDAWFLWPDLEGRIPRSTLSATFHKDGLEHSLRSTESDIFCLSFEELVPNINSAFEL